MEISYIVHLYLTFLQFFLKIILHAAIWYQVFLSNTNNFQTDSFDSQMGP